jgi:adenylate kinase
MFRSAVAEGTDLGKKAKELMSGGKLVPDEIVNEMVDWRLRKPDAEGGFILDGYPRTKGQAEALERNLQDRRLQLDAVILFEFEEEALIERASSRVVCRGCGTPYNTRSAPPKTAGICDRCGQPLYRRDDDRPEIIRERIRVYGEQTAPLIAFYEQRSILRRVDASRSIDAVAKELDRIFPKKAEARG